ncbi:MAG: HNH endonuclease [Candidatus Saganbacteria bacterium]|nr:HNH endonuclease [Candidatus Saganbacteria bacterium]
MKTPNKPFPNYKWRWAVLTPTEGINDPPVYWGVLRALRLHEGQPPNSAGFIRALEKVQSETKTKVNLVRTKERNLIRNSGQYWKSLGLLGDSRGEIELTEYGRKVADGLITKSEFALTTIKTLELPHFDEDKSEWEKNGLIIKPLELLLQILTGLKIDHGVKEAYLTTEELIKIVIPLAGVKSKLNEYLEAIMLFRHKKIDINKWPDCALLANDRRMAREFLLFLFHYDICDRVYDEQGNEKFILSGIDLERRDIDAFASKEFRYNKPEDVIPDIRKMRELTDRERERVVREVTSRPNQPIFRNNVLTAFNYKCIITGVGLPSVLEAAHIIPVTNSGTDQISNGLCMRSDIHILFDAGHLRIEDNGGIHLSEQAQKESVYANLPKRIILPRFVSMGSIRWRWQYF